MSTEQEYYEHLVKIMLKTRGVRFSVSESEMKKEKFSLLTVSVLSIYLATWSLTLALFPALFTEFQNKALGLLSAIASISLLVISIFDYAAGRSVFAEKMLQNAFSITGILRESERELASSSPRYSRLAELASDYEAIVTGAGINHSSLDYKIWQMEREKADGFIGQSALRVKRYFLRIFSFTVAMAFQLLLLVFIIASTVAVLTF